MAVKCFITGRSLNIWKKNFEETLNEGVQTKKEIDKVEELISKIRGKNLLNSGLNEFFIKTFFSLSLMRVFSMS
jgi:hypothetical protein